MNIPIASRFDELSASVCRFGNTDRSFLSTLLVSLLVLPAASQAATAPPLGTAASFAVLGASTVTNTGPTIVYGDLGVSPGSAVVDFPPGIVTGTIYTTVLSNAGPAQADALAAYNDAAAQACDTDLTGMDLGGLTLTPGVYCFDVSAALTGTLTLDFEGDSSAVFVFQIGSTITTATDSAVVTINGSPSCHQVFWQVGSSATLGTGTDFQGDILALAAITANTGATTTGSLYALTEAVTLDNNLVGTCQCADDTECLDDGNICTDEVCDPGAPGADADGCTHPANTAACDDTLFCTEGDVCDAGLCAGTAIDCGDGNLCTTDTCDEGADECVNAANTLPCDDTLFCTEGDVCDAGLCAGLPIDCGDGDVCTTDTCDEGADECLNSPNTLPCDDGLFCTEGDVCGSGLCAGVAFDCGDGNLCTTDSCDEGADLCVNAPNTLPCDDALFCNGTDVCAGGVCGHTGDPCVGGGVCGDLCDEIADNCLDVAGTQCRPAAGICDVAELCTGASADCPADELAPGGTICRVDAGVCDLAELCTGTSADCPINLFEPVATPCTTDNNICTNDECDGAGTCTYTDNAVPCDDGSSCTGPDVCLNGTCSSGASTSCGDGVVDLACGEECDAPGEETCNNDVDDDGDGFFDCADSDCVDPPVASCSPQCLTVAPCSVVLNDPATIYPSNMDPRARARGSFNFHGRMIPTTSVDPEAESFVVTISNDNGVVYRAELPPGALALTSKRRYVYRSPHRDSLIDTGGIDRMYVRRRKDEGQVGYGVRVRAFGDFSRATLARMTTQVYLGDDVAYLTANWKLRNGRWTLYQKDF